MRIATTIVSATLLALASDWLLAQDYLKDGQLAHLLKVVQLQGGFAGFTGVQFTIARDGSWTSENVFNQKITPKSKGKLTEKALAKLAAILEKYDLAKLPAKSGKQPGANPHTITLEYGKTKATLVGLTPPTLDPKNPTATVENRFAGIWEGVVGLLTPKEDGQAKDEAIDKDRKQIDAPLALHPDNPHYFLFRGKSTVLITSAEHYGAVLNLDFDYKKYLNELHANGLNLTRTFTGVYAEDAKAFGITRNSLAPTKCKLLCPWARSDSPGYAGGGNKFDLAKWDQAYFARLKDFLAQAGKRGIVVELNLFCPFYDDSMWKLSPMNSANNVNDVGKLARESIYNRKTNGSLQAIQENFGRKLVTELNGFDNLYFEVCNEPYFGGVTDDWLRRIIDVIVESEKPLPNKHLISLNIANGTKQVENPHPAVSIFNFHYASPPDAVRTNYKLDKVIGDNETGFKGTADTHYRMEGSEFILAGGGLYNNLDYSFVVGHEDGSFAVPPKSPGGGNRGFRRQMKVLSDFMHGIDFVRLRPDDKVVKGGLPAKGHARVLSEPGKQYAVYLFGGPVANLTLELPSGRYQADWVDPVSGKVVQTGVLNAAGAVTELRCPRFDPDIAQRVVRTE